MIKNKALAQILKNQYLILYYLRHCESCKNLMEDINEITDKALMKTEYFTDKLLHRRRIRKKHFLLILSKSVSAHNFQNKRENN